MVEPELQSSFLMAAYSILRHQRQSLSARNLTAIAIDEGYLDRDRKGGATPSQTMKSKLSVHIRRHGDSSVFVRTGPGRFYLREMLDSPTAEYRPPPFRAAAPNERVMAFDQGILDQIGRFQGVTRIWQPYYRGLALGGECHAVDRMVAEDTDTAKQLLTYILVRRQDGALLCFDRGVINRVDESLRGSSCVGFGGHVKALERTLFDNDNVGLFRNAATELLEELRVPEAESIALRTDPTDLLPIIGVLNDDSSPNGVRHFAFVLQYSVRDEAPWLSPRGREKSINRVRWLTAESARSESVHQFEFWSQLCLREYASELATATPKYRVRRPRVLARAKIVCLVGQMGSGKTEAASRLTQEFGFDEINSGRVVAELLDIPPVPETPRAVFQAAAEAFIRQPEGPTQLAAAISARAEQSQRRVLVDGIRHLETLDSLRHRSGRHGVAVVYVHAPFDVAFQMYRQREEPGVSIAAFVSGRRAAVESQVAQMVDLADAALYNWIGLEEYTRILDAFGRELFC